MAGPTHDSSALQLHRCCTSAGSALCCAQTAVPSTLTRSQRTSEASLRSPAHSKTAARSPRRADGMPAGLSARAQHCRHGVVRAPPRAFSW